MTTLADLPERFWRKVDQTTSATGCWLWTGATNPKHNGYPIYRHLGNTVAGHRLIASIVLGPIPPGMCVMHSCDTPSCLNPDHLSIGSQADNMADAYNKKRRTVPRMPGESNPRAKLTEAQARDIKFNHTKVPSRKLAQQFGISPSTILDIRHGRSWQHLD